MRMRGIDVRVDLAAVAENYRILRGMIAQDCIVAPAVKADAYGLGMADIVQVLTTAGARAFFVAWPEEGVVLRRALAEIAPQAEIFILSGFMQKFAREYTAHHLIPVLNSLHEIAAYCAGARDFGRNLPAALHFDTGMNRLGIEAHEAQKIVDDMGILRGLDVRCVMSHFASADEADSPFTAQQAERFAKIAQHFPRARKSLANSGGIFRSSTYHYDMVRPGLALYGGNPVPERENPMRPVLSAFAPVLQVHRVKRGESAGYNQTHIFAADGYVAVASVGYADGLHRALSNCGALYWGEYRLRICGRVSMDLVICDLSGVPEAQFPAIGQNLEIIGCHQSIETLAQAAGTNAYEVLTSIGGAARHVQGRA